MDQKSVAIPYGEIFRCRQLDRALFKPAAFFKIISRKRIQRLYDDILGKGADLRLVYDRRRKDSALFLVRDLWYMQKDISHAQTERACQNCRNYAMVLARIGNKYTEPGLKKS